MVFSSLDPAHASGAGTSGAANNGAANGAANSAASSTGASNTGTSKTVRHDDVTLDGVASGPSVEAAAIIKVPLKNSTAPFASGAAASSAPASVSPPAHAPVLGEYTDYRQYLKDVYDYRRATEATGMRSYSYSTFSAAADIKSPNYLKLIIEGRRNLSDEMITRFAKALRLARPEAEEFRALVLYGQAFEPMERNQHLKALADMRAQRAFAADVVNQRSWGKVPGWIGWVIYAMAEQRDVKFDPETLQKLFRAKAGAEEIRTSLNKLLESGELARDNETGEIYKVRDLVDSPQDLPVPLIRKLQAELIYLGIESLFRDSPKDREFGAMTVAMTEEEFQQVRFELRQMRKRLQRDILVKRKSSKGERVYQLNVQLFPVTEKVEAK